MAANPFDSYLPARLRGGGTTPAVPGAVTRGNDLDRYLPERLRTGAKAVEEEESSPSLLSRAGSVLHGVGDVVSSPFRGLGMLATGIQEELADTPAEQSRLTVRPDASLWDKALGVDVNAPNPAQLAVEGYKALPQFLAGQADISGPSGIRGEDEVTRRGFERGHASLARAEAVAEPLAELGFQFATDPAMVGLGALGAAGKFGRAAGRGIAASFVPGMVEGAREQGQEFLRAGAEEGYLSPAALRAGVGALTMGGMALGTGLHAAGIGGHGTTERGKVEEVARATEIDPLEGTALEMQRARLAQELAGEPLISPVVDPLRPVADAAAPPVEARRPPADLAAMERARVEAAAALEAPLAPEPLPVEAVAAPIAVSPVEALAPRPELAAPEVPLERLIPEQQSAAPPESPSSPAADPLPAPGPSSPVREAIAPEFPVKPEAALLAGESAPVVLPESLAPEMRVAGAERRVETGPVEIERRVADRRAQIAAEHPDLPPKALDMLAKAEVERETERVRADEAETDPITRLPTRAVFERKLKTHNGGVASLDVSGLKFVNDNLGGHPTGDKFLRALGEAAKAEPGVEVARIGGDELGLLAESEAAADAASRSIQERFAKAKFGARLPDGTQVEYTGGRVDYGAGKYEAQTGPADFERADTRLYEARQAAVASGERSSTPGSRPRGLVEVPAGGERVPGDAPAGDKALTPRPGEPAPAPLPPSKPLIDGDAALARMQERAAKLGKDTANFGGLDVVAKNLGDMAVYGASLIERGARNFAQWSKEMVSTIGEHIVPHLKELWTKAQETWQSHRAAMDARYGPSEQGAFKFGKVEPLPPESAIPAAAAPPPIEPPGPPPKPRPVRPIPEPLKAVPAPDTVLGKEGRAAAIRAANADIGPAAEGKPPSTAINFERIGTADHVKDMQGRIVGALKEQLGEAKGYRSWEQAREKALASGLTEKDFVRMMRDKEGVSDHVIEAGRMMREESAKVAAGKIEQAAELKRSGGDETKVLEAQREADAAVAKHAAVTWATVRAGSEAGRALAIHAKLSEGLTPSERFFKRALREVPLMSEAQRNALAKAVVKNDPAEIAKITREAFKPSLTDKFLEYWKAGLVSGPPTIAGNFLGNALFETWRTVERGAAGVADAAYSAATGAERTRYAGEALKAMTSLRTSIPRAASVFWDVLKDPRADFDLTGETRVEHAVPKIGGRTGEVIRTPFRVLKAFDEAAKHVARQNELFAQSYRMAKLEKAGNVNARMAEIVKSTGEYQEAVRARKAGATLTPEQRATLADPRAQKIAQSMEDAALNSTFQDQAGKITQGILLMRGTNPLWEIILPFVKTPSRILSAGLERTPLGFAKVWKGVHEGTLKDRGQIVDAMVKPMMGTMLGLGFVAAAKEGLLTGSGPADPKERRLLEATGWQPFSIKVGDQYYSYKRMEPLATTLGLAADFVEASNEERGKLAEKIQAAVVDNITSKSYLQGVANFGELLADPKRYAGTFLKGLEGSLVPNVVAKVASALDDKVRDTRGPLGPIAARLPGVSRLLETRKGATGEEITRPGTALERLASPLPRTTAKDAPLERELLSVGYAPSSPGRTLTVPHTQGKLKVELTPDEYAVMQDYDRQASERIRKALRAPGYRALDPEERRRYVERIYRDAGTAARRDVMRRTTFKTRAQARMKELREARA